MLKDERGYCCALCGQLLDIPADAKPRFSVRGSGGQPNQRILSINDIEIHRCTVVSRTDLATR